MPEIETPNTLVKKASFLCRDSTVVVLFRTAKRRKSKYHVGVIENFARGWKSVTFFGVKTVRPECSICRPFDMGNRRSSPPVPQVQTRHETNAKNTQVVWGNHTFSRRCYTVFMVFFDHWRAREDCSSSRLGSRLDTLSPSTASAIVMGRVGRLQQVAILHPYDAR